MNTILLYAALAAFGGIVFYLWVQKTNQNNLKVVFFRLKVEIEPKLEDVKRILAESKVNEARHMEYRDCLSRYNNLCTLTHDSKTNWIHAHNYYQRINENLESLVTDIEYDMKLLTRAETEGPQLLAGIPERLQRLKRLRQREDLRSERKQLQRAESALLQIQLYVQEVGQDKIDWFRVYDFFDIVVEAEKTAMKNGWAIDRRHSSARVPTLFVNKRD